MISDAQIGFSDDLRHLRVWAVGTTRDGRLVELVSLRYGEILARPGGRDAFRRYLYERGNSVPAACNGPLVSLNRHAIKFWNWICSCFHGTTSELSLHELRNV